MRAETPSQKIIGGVFGLEPGVSTPATSQAFLTETCLLLATARSAFRLLERHLQPRRVWLPSYLCAVMLEAFEQTPIHFYAMDEHLRPADGWLCEIRPGDVVIFIDYFGFAFWEEHGREARRSGAWVVEDACQAMLNDRFSEHSHYVITSPRKFVGVPDGGVLLAAAGTDLPPCELPAPSAEWWLGALAAAQLRGEFDRHGGDRGWFHLFQQAEAASPCEPTRMSELSSLLLRHSINYDAVTRRRRENYRVLASELKHLAMFPDLPSHVTPLGFPIRILDRDRTRHILFGGDIYPPVHWPLAGAVPAVFTASHQLSDEIMTLPCDQRYDVGEMQRMVDCLKAANPVAASAA